MDRQIRESLPANKLRRNCDPAQFSFETTAELGDLAAPLGQNRAIAALEFGLGIAQQGYNVFVAGPEGAGKRSLVAGILRDVRERSPAPSDWCYVHNFEHPDRPKMLRLPPGKGVALRDDMRAFIDDLRAGLEAAFESDEYKTRRQVIDDEFEDKPRAALTKLNEEAKKKGFAVLRTPTGFLLAPVRDGEVLGPDDFEKLDDEEKERIGKESSEFDEKGRELAEQIPEWDRERRKKTHELNMEIASTVIGRLTGPLLSQYGGLDGLADYLKAVEADVREHAFDFIQPQDTGREHSQGQAIATPLPESLSGPFALRRYQVNVIVEHGGEKQAPIIFEDNPTYQNLVGRIEHVSQFGNLMTDFRLIRPGSLHRANGGYLVVEAHKLLTQPFAWEGLKRALTSKEIVIESLGQALSLISTISTDPEPVPLDVKVILLGDRRLYYLLQGLDPEFGTLFKVQSDFSDVVDRTADRELQTAELLAGIVKRHELRPFHRTAVARLIDEQARSSGDGERLSTHAASLVDLAVQADFYAGRAESLVVVAEHVDEAVEAGIFRADRIRERMLDEVARGTIVIDTDGTRVGRINGLSVVQLGDFSFGRPTRISAQASLGKAGVVDIEREVELGGPIHSKGVLILSAFLAGRYAADRPMALSATLVFEQSYGGVDGDSASSAELLALLSCLSDVPLRQDLAVTGSVNQHGNVQAIGGVNEKIEGFFDLCKLRGLTGKQGVLIPTSNVPHLMLKKSVVSAVERGRFHVYPIGTIDEAVELLTMRSAGERDEAGAFPEGSINRLVEDRLEELATTLARYGARDKRESEQ